MATDERTAPVGQVIRDFIPEGEELTEAEKQRFHSRPLGPTSRPTAEFVVADFIPAEGQEAQPIPTPEEAHKRAEDAARKTGEVYARRQFEDAKEVLTRGDLSVGNTIDYLRHLGPYERDVFLVAEARGLKRREILDAFPSPDPRVKSRFTPRKRRKKAAAEKSKDETVKDNE